jgi:hypothetical protein|nr:MAG TPA: hypothetical protein [Caudoviricetes sp.]
MLTRQERQEIAERAKECKKEDELSWDQFSYVLLGIQSWRNDDELLDRIVELCDTSNMIGLPLDKDGEVIRIHDVVYDNTGMEREVSEFRFPFYGACIYARTDDDRSTFRPDELAHKKQVTIKSLVEELRSTLCAAYISGRECEKILHIADQLERLGDSDD